MRIVHICLKGLIMDGWSYQENLMPKYHRLDGHDVTMITSRWIDGGADNLQLSENLDYYNADGVHIIRLSMIGRENFNRKFNRFYRLYETIEQANPDIIFVHGVSFLDITTIVRYKKAHMNVIVYADNHADFSNSATNWLSKNVLHGIVWKHYAKKLVPYCKKFYGVLPARVDFLINIYGIPKEKCELLVMGADDELVKEARREEAKQSLRSKYGISESDFLIMTGGRIVKSKAQTILLMQAVHLFKDPKVKLIVFGSVSEELKDKIDELCDGDSVQYIGWIDAKESYSYFAAADLVVFPGRHSVFWEQVAGLGIPMMVKDWEGTHHIDLGGNVSFIEDDSAESIYNMLNEIVYNKQKYESMKTLAEEKGMDVFSYRSISRRAIEVTV